MFLGLHLLVFLCLGNFIHHAHGVYEYAAMCIPTHYRSTPQNSGCTMFIHTGFVPANINITTIDSSEFLQLEAGEMYKTSFGQDMFPLDGAESKAIRLTSDVEIQVLVQKDSYLSHDNFTFTDTYQVPSMQGSGTFFITSAFDISCPNPDFVSQFYLISTFSDNTVIEVTQGDDPPFEVTLQNFGTFATASFDDEEVVANGTIITSSMPVNVISGNLCSNNPSGGSYFSAIPPANKLAREYVVPHVISQDVPTPGFDLNVIAVEDDTVVWFDGNVVELPTAGSGITFDREDTVNTMFVNCSKDCLAVQFTKSVRYAYGLLMMSLLPLQEFSTHAFFTTLDLHPMSYMSLVVEGEEPGNDILLNGQSLESLNWTTSYGYASAETAFPNGPYVLESTAGRRFAAYVYSHTMEYSSGGAGYALLPLPSESGPTPAPTTSPTPPPPSGNYSLPQVSVSVNGTVYTEDGQDMTPSCAQAHIQNLNMKTAAMVVEVNKAIGVDICLEEDNIVVASGTAFMITDGQKGLLDIRHNLLVEGHHLAAQVEACSAEIAVYLADHANWEQPIFPDVPQCSRLVFVPPYFDIVGAFWNCNNQDQEDGYAMQNFLLFKSEVGEVFNTSDGSILDLDCTAAYGSEAEKKTNAMLSSLSDMIAVSSCAGAIQTVSQTTSFIGFGNQAYYLASFYYAPLDSASFDEFMACAVPVHDFSQQHENWGTQPGSPFLPVPPGCPALEHDGSRLDDEGYQWMCVDTV